jgi:hypothetical protein
MQRNRFEAARVDRLTSQGTQCCTDHAHLAIDKDITQTTAATHIGLRKLLLVSTVLLRFLDAFACSRSL